MDNILDKEIIDLTASYKENIIDRKAGRSELASWYIVDCYISSIRFFLDKNSKSIDFELKQIYRRLGP